MNNPVVVPAQIDPTVPRRSRHRLRWWQRRRGRQLVLVGASPVLGLAILLLYLRHQQRVREEFIQFHQQRQAQAVPKQITPPALASPLTDPLLTRAQRLARAGHPASAAILLRKLLERQPESVAGRVSLALALVELGESAQAIAEYRRVLAADPVHLVALNNLADLLACHPQADLRNGPLALELAARAAGAAPDNPAVLATLASAQAENGQLKQAVRTAERAIDQANFIGQRGLAEIIANQLRWYEQGLPYREPRFSGSN